MTSPESKNPPALDERVGHVLFDTLREPVLLLDDELRVAAVNRAFCVSFETAAEDALGRNIYDLQHGRWNIPALTSLLEGTPAAKPVIEGFELEQDFGPGGRKTLVLNVRRLEPADGGTGMIVLAFQDVTQERRTARRLQQQAFEAKMVHQASELAAETTSFDEALESCVETVCRLTGWPVGHAFLPDESGRWLVSTNIWHLTDRRKYDSIRRATEAVCFARGEGLPGRIWARGEPLWIKNVREDRKFPRFKQGKELSIKGAFGFPIKIRGEIVAILEFFKDEELEPDARLLMTVRSLGRQVGRVIERKRAEEERARLAAIVDSSSDAIIGMSLEGTILTWNVGAERVYGYTENEAVGRPIAMMIPRDRPEERDAILREVRRGHRLEQFETRRIRKDGRHIEVSLTTSPVLSPEGRVIAASTVERDITDRKRWEDELQAAKDAAEAANRAKSVFLANVSHELRTPMNSIIGMTELALDEELSEVVRDYLETVKGSADSLMTLLNDILDISKLEAGRFEIESAVFEVRETVDATIKRLAVPAFEKGLDVTCRVEDDVPELLVGDPVRFGQVLTNLVSNAVKFTESGGIGVHVRNENESGEDGAIIIRTTVADTGIGVPEELQASIFDPFTQGDSSTTRGFGGTGLGLAICRELVQRMDGSITLQSAPGEGSRFSFTVRFGRADQTRLLEREPPQKLAAGPPPPRPLRILLAEDTPANQKVMTAILGKRGHLVETAVNGRDAVEMYKNGPFDAILMDVQMPVMDGFQATGVIRSMERPRGTRVPIVAMTAHVMQGDRERCLAAGMDGYLSKPIDPPKLIRTVERLARRSRQAAGVRRQESEDRSQETGVRGQETVWNREDALRRMDGNESLLTELATYFLEDAPKLLDEVHSAFDENDAEKLRRAAHSLKGLAANFDANEAVDAAQVLEKLAETGEPGEPHEDALHRLNFEVNRLGAALQEELQL